MSRKLHTILLALGLSAMIALIGCDNSDDETAVVAPNAPTGVTATILAPNKVGVSWTASALDEGPDGYAIERRVEAGSWGEIGSVASTVTIYNDLTVDIGSGTTYEYRVGAYNAGGKTYSNSTYVTIQTFRELLLGTWDAVDPVNTLGTDSSTFVFQLDGSDYEYRRLDYYDSIDESDWDAGTYSASGTLISFTVQAINGAFVDSSYAFSYTMETDGEGITVDVDYGEGPIQVEYEKVIIPVD